MRCGWNERDVGARGLRSHVGQSVLASRFERLALAVCALAACSEYKPDDDTWSSVNQLGTGDWSCLQTTLKPVNPPGSLGDPLLYSLRLVDLATDQGFADVQVTACGLTDIACNAPVVTRTTDELGLVGIPLFENFTGYLLISSPEVVPYLFQFPDTGVGDMLDYPLYMISLESYIEFLQVFMLPSDSRLGAVAVRAFDCQGRPAAGVELELEEGAGGQRWYFRDRLPNPRLDQTDESGLSGYIGVKPGVWTLDARLQGATPIFRQSIIVRAGWMTAGYMVPSGAVD